MKKIIDKGLKLCIESHTLLMLKEWNEELINKYKNKHKEFKDFIMKHKGGK